MEWSALRPHGSAALGWAAALLFCAGCAGPSAKSEKAVNAMIASGNYAGAESYLDSHKESEYGKKNMVLYYLDKGMIEHHEGKYAESDQSFDRAETRMDELYTKSITKMGGMILLNDNTVDYAGEPFERALTNVFRALNYVFLGKPDEALVESRKVEMFLDELNRNAPKKPVYKDDVFARYLDSLLYADAGQSDDARISREAAEEAYRWYASDYRVPVPKFDLRKDASEGELVFIHYNGVAPRKVSKTFQVAWGEAAVLVNQNHDEDSDSQRAKNALRAGFTGHSVTVAYPEYVQDPFAIASSEVTVDDESKGATQLMEDISAIAFKDLSDRQGLIRARAVARAAVKYILAETAARAAQAHLDKEYGQGSAAASILGGIGRGLAHGAAAATEIADTRGWSALPSQIRMARIALPPGTHQIRIDFKNAAGSVVASRVFKDVKVEKARRTYLSLRTAS